MIIADLRARRGPDVRCAATVPPIASTLTPENTAPTTQSGSRVPRQHAPCRRARRQYISRTRSRAPFGRIKSGTRERLRFSYLRFLTRACSFSLQVSGRTSDTNPSVISLLKARSFSKRLRPWRSAAVRNGTFEDSSSSSSCRWRRPSPLGMTPHRHSDAKQAPDQ